MDITDRMVGAHPLENQADGSGTQLNFVGIPDNMIGSFLEDVSGLDGSHTHPLRGAAYFQGTANAETFRLIIFQQDMEMSVVEAYARWCMRRYYSRYESDETRAALDALIPLVP